MSAIAVVGANWGDEGKGKIVDFLSARANIVVRYQGGSNAGHTIINEYGKFVLHLLPSGVFYPHMINILGPGVALNVNIFLRELNELTQRGVPTPTIKISDRTQVVLPYHLLLDEYEEERLGTGQFGSTKNGIAPFYADKMMKVGVQVADLFSEDRLRARLNMSLAAKNVLFQHLYNKPRLSVDDLVPNLLADGRQIEPFVCDTLPLLHEALASEKTVLLEGQLGALRDPDHGIYPYPTSSSPLAGFASVGAGIPPYTIRRIVAVVKAYSSCVGAGPFATESHGANGEELRRKGGDAGEYGATTGRPRRVGWFDIVATRYGCQVQGATEIALTLLDVLGYLEQIPICTAYDIDGEMIEHFPTTDKLERARPVYESLPGWQCDISGIRVFEDLPSQTRKYVAKVEEHIGLPVKSLSVGPHRNAMIVR